MIRDDRGSATVFAVAVLAVLFSLVVLGVRVGEAVVLRHRVTAAADLAALAAAGALASGGGGEEACRRARWVAERTGAALDSCAVSGREVTVALSAPLAGVGTTNANARAGPAEA
ncbi:Rv3654c family TadE-like protein [Umezawaea beigongshangensis]|uniref:Rv3654c family TadE-like protein n=1 Tax=Umezawaea beigongshangensis TaxID=2780383 RepID=UPI0027DB313F|nr:Rv3654c family TadE-like protein [Umezawaea beigongshangensis]